MKKDKRTTTPGEFVIKIPQLNFVLLVLVIPLSLLGFDFILCYWMVGVLVAVAGTYLGAPSSREIPPGMLEENLNRPVKSYLVRLLGMLENKVPSYGVGNMLFYSGLIALAITTPFICKIRFP